MIVLLATRFGLLLLAMQSRSVATENVVPGSEGGGTLTGVVRYTDPVPTPEKVAVTRDHETCGQQIVRPRIKTDREGRVAEAVVWLLAVPQVKRAPPPPVVLLDQRGCEFQPHVLAVRVGQDVEIRNSDDLPHNINSRDGAYTLFNILQPQKGLKTVRKFTQPGLIVVRCNVHSWMLAYMHVFDHPYFAVTSDEGSFKISGIPAGRYDLVVWQEHVGERRYKVAIKPGELTNLDIVLSSSKGR